jgi:hypothetical protein
MGNIPSSYLVEHSIKKILLAATIPVENNIMGAKDLALRLSEAVMMTIPYTTLSYNADNGIVVEVVDDKRFSDALRSNIRVTPTRMMLWGMRRKIETNLHTTHRSILDIQNAQEEVSFVDSLDPMRRSALASFDMLAVQYGMLLATQACLKINDGDEDFFTPDEGKLKKQTAIDAIKWERISDRLPQGAQDCAMQIHQNMRQILCSAQAKRICNHIFSQLVIYNKSPDLQPNQIMMGINKIQFDDSTPEVRDVTLKSKKSSVEVEVAKMSFQHLLKEALEQQYDQGAPSFQGGVWVVSNVVKSFMQHPVIQSAIAQTS